MDYNSSRTVKTYLVGNQEFSYDKSTSYSGAAITDSSISMNLFGMAGDCTVGTVMDDGRRLVLSVDASSTKNLKGKTLEELDEAGILQEVSIFEGNHVETYKCEINGNKKTEYIDSDGDNTFDTTNYYEDNKLKYSSIKQKDNSEESKDKIYGLDRNDDGKSEISVNCNSDEGIYIEDNRTTEEVISDYKYAWNAFKSAVSSIFSKKT